MNYTAAIYLHLQESQLDFPGERFSVPTPMFPSLLERILELDALLGTCSLRTYLHRGFYVIGFASVIIKQKSLAQGTSIAPSTLRHRGSNPVPQKSGIEPNALRHRGSNPVHSAI